MNAKDAAQRLQVFERQYGRETAGLASHAALPVVVNADVLHLLRINYFLDPPHVLPYTAEGALLLSSLCTEIDDGLYMIEAELRDLLLKRLVEDYGGARVRDVARLLWEYSQRGAPWAQRPGLTEAQQLTALNFIDPPRALGWLARARRGEGALPVDDDRWFVVLERDLVDRAQAIEEAEGEAVALAGKVPALTELRDVLTTLVPNLPTLIGLPPQAEASRSWQDALDAAWVTNRMPELLEAVTKKVGSSEIWDRALREYWFRLSPALRVEQGTFETPPPEWQILEDHRGQLEKAIRALAVIFFEGPSSGGPRVGGMGTLVGNYTVITHASMGEEPFQGGRLKKGYRVYAEFADEHPVLNDKMGPRSQRRIDLIGTAVEEKTKLLILTSDPKADRSLLPEPLRVMTERPGLLEGRKVCVMGYPARDTRHDMAVLSRVFGDVYGILRLQPGQVLEEKAEEILVVHNCFTAGGNGGSALIDIETGEVLGLHFAGWYRPGSAGFKQGHAIATYRLAQHPLLVSNGVFGIRADDQRETTFVDRVAEQDVFRHMLFQQRGQVLFVRGWAGMGKTALLRRYAQMAAENGMRTVFLRGRGDLPFASSLDDAAWSLAAPVILIDNADEYPSSLIANLIENVLANDTQLRVLVVAGRDFNTPRQYARHVDVLVLELKPLPRRVVAEWLDAQKLDTTPEVIETITSMSGGVPAMVATLIANLGNVLSDRPDIRDIERRIGLRTVSVTSPTDKAIVFQDDGWETHGRFVVTRGIHTLTVPSHYKIGQYLLTNGVYDEFVRAGGYRYKEFWGTVPASTRKSFTCRDGTPGPATWPSATVEPQSAEYPVTGISYYEAVAFIAWLGLNRAAPDGMQWCLPSENMWEFAARGEEGLRYPWGPEFEEGRCNSAEAGLNATSPAGNFPEGKSPFGAHDMAGNVWEFVRAFDHDQTSCVLRGGSFKNTRDEVKSTLRLVKVPRHHRPPDFGFRVALEPRGSTDAAPPKR